MNKRKLCLFPNLLGMILLLVVNQAAANAPSDTWPDKPVRFIVPFPPGGSVDPLARLIGGRLSNSLGQQFIVDNRAGGSGSIGTGVTVKSAPDGYTYLFVFDNHGVNPALIPNLAYDTLKDLAPVMLIGTAPMAIASHPNKPFQNFSDIIKGAKSKPAALSYGTIAAGSLGHLTMTLLEQAGGFKLVHVPYKGGGPMTVDALGGQIDMGIASVAVLSPHVRTGKLRAVAVTGNKRSHVLPDVASLSEQGFPGFSALAWWAVVGPSGIPQPLLKRFHDEVTKVLNIPEVRGQLADQLGMDLVVSSPENLQKWITTEVARWGKVVRDNNIRMD